MPGTFFDTFNPTLIDIEASFTEEWTFKGASWPAIFIDTLEETDHVIKGGVLQVTAAAIHVRLEVFQQSGVKLGDIVTVRGSNLSVNGISSDGDAARVLSCGPEGLDIWK